MALLSRYEWRTEFWKVGSGDVRVDCDVVLEDLLSLKDGYTLALSGGEAVLRGSGIPITLETKLSVTPGVLRRALGGGRANCRVARALSEAVGGSLCHASDGRLEVILVPEWVEVADV